MQNLALEKQTRALEAQIHTEVWALADGKTKNLIIRAPEWKTKVSPVKESCNELAGMKCGRRGVAGWIRAESSVKGCFSKK